MVVDRARIACFRAQGLSCAKIVAQLGVCVGEKTVYGPAHASAKKPIGIVPVSPCALAALLAVVYFREGRAQDALTTVEKAYDEVTKYKLAPQFHNQVIKIGKAIE